MPSALLLPLLTCAVVLLVSGVAKVRTPDAVDRAFTSLGVPSALDRPVLRRALPWVEVGLGLWLLLAAGPVLVAGAAAVLVLLLVYLVLVATAVRAPQPASCGCFGSLGDDRVTRVTVWRNAALVLAGALGLLGATRGVAVRPAALGATGGSPAWAWLLAAALAVVVAVLAAWRPRAAPATGHGAPPPAPDPDEYVRTPIPQAVVLDEDRRMRLLAHEAGQAARLLVFLSPGCAPCLRLGPLVAGWARDLDPVRVHAVVVGDPDVLEGLPHLVGHAWFDPFGITRQAFAAGTPAAVLLGTDGHLAGGPVRGEEEVLAFVDEVAAHLDEARAGA